MENYYGFKKVSAMPMTKGEANKKCNHTISSKFGSSSEGYLVKSEDGYVSWSPKEEFENTFSLCPGTGASFGKALMHIQQRKGIRLPHWEPGLTVRLATCINEHILPFLFIGNEDVKEVWTPSPGELLSCDWEVVD